MRRVRNLQPGLVIAHSEPAMVAAAGFLRNGGTAGVDMEDWFSEDLLARERKSRPLALIVSMESQLLRADCHATCTSEAMAQALVERYGCRKPVVVRNVFPSAERASIDGRWEDRAHSPGCPDRNVPLSKRPSIMPVSIHWFSQTIGPGRGLEDLLVACRHLQGDFELHLRGDSTRYTSWLEGAVSGLPRAKICLHAPVSNADLPARIAEHDVGFAGEVTDIPSRNLTITNKFFQYLQGGLAVVASATAGQREAAACAPEAVALYQSGDTYGLGQVLQQLISNRHRLDAMRAAAWRAGALLCWEDEAPRLVQSVERCLAGLKASPSSQTR